jgi:hypothetical protein
MNTKDQEILKQNAINLVQHHKKHCDGETCCISVFLVERLIREAGIELTTEESMVFL